MNKTKISVGVSLLTFFATVGYVVVVGAIFQNKNAAQIKRTKEIEKAIADVNNQEISETPNLITEDVVKLHSTPDDCWMIIDKNVYNFTSFISQHPGGAVSMIPYCGKDGSRGFATKDKKAPTSHTQNASNMLSQYLVGPLGKPLNNSQLDKLAKNSKTAVNNSKTSVSSTSKSTTATSFSTNINSSGSTSQLSSSSITLSSSEIASHNTIQNCWLIISNNVYNVTNYLSQHPGGIGVISPYCGKEATSAFQTKNTGSSHSGSAYSQLNQYLIGSVGSSVAVTTPSNNNNGNTTGGNTSGTTNNPTATPTRIVVATITPIPNSNLTLSTQEIATHNTLQNCWLIISNKVYNVTTYVYQHPGGSNTIQSFCGKEATSAFQTKGGNGSNHSNNAYNLLGQFLIGNVGSTVVSSPTPTTPAGGGGGQTQPTATNTPSQQGTLPASVVAKYPGATIVSQNIEDNGSQELKINYNGQCRQLKVNSSGSITQDERC